MEQPSRPLVNLLAIHDGEFKSCQDNKRRPRSLFNLAYFRYTLDINPTDEQVNHPLMREAEGIISGMSTCHAAHKHRSDLHYFRSCRP